MSDAKLFWFGFDEDTTFQTNDLPVDEGLSTAVLLSLFVDKRASLEQLESIVEDPRGFWGDSDQDVHGSHLWLIDREKITPTLLEKIKSYAESALRWLLNDEIASEVNVDISRTGTYSIQMNVSIRQGTNKIYQYLWDAHKNETFSTENINIQIEAL